MTTQQITQLKFNRLTEAQYEDTTPVDNEFYITTDANYALDSEAVHKSGDETITGQKTLTASNIITNHTHIKNESVEQLTVPSSYSERMIQATDMNGVRIGSLGFAITADGSSRTYIESSKNINGEQTYGIIESYTDLNGNHSYYIGGNLVKAFIKDSWISGTNWYRVWSDGWIEQGGVWSGVAANASATRNLLKPFDTTDYTCVLQPNTSSYANNGIHYIVSKTKTTTTISGYGTSSADLIWHAMGY